MTSIGNRIQARFIIGVIAVSSASAPGIARADAMYSATDVGASLGVANTYAFGEQLNSQGQVLFYVDSGGPNNAYLYSVAN